MRLLEQIRRWIRARGRSGRDQRAVSALRADRLGSLEEIHARHQSGVFSLCLAMLGDPDEASDAVEATFLEAYFTISRGEEEIELRPRLYSIAYRECLRRRGQNGHAQAHPGPSSWPRRTDAERRGELPGILEGLDSLPDDQRAAQTLASLGLSEAEIAEVLDGGSAAQ